MEETMFYLTIVVEELILKHGCCYVDNFYNAIKEINKDYLKSEEYRKDEGLLDRTMTLDWASFELCVDFSIGLLQPTKARVVIKDKTKILFFI